MDTISVDPEPISAWRRLRRGLEHVQNWPANGNSPYSLFFCMFLLFAVGLIVEIGR